MIPTITEGIAQGTSERAGEPAALQVLAEQEGEAEREAEADRRHGDRPDQADLERVDEELVVEQRAEVVEPDEGRRDAEAGLRVGEAEVDPAHERDDAEDHDRQQRRNQQASVSRPRARARPAPRPAGNGRPRDGAHARAPEEARTTRRGSTPTTWASRPGSSIRASRSSAAIRALVRAEVDRGQRRPGQRREIAVVHPDERDVPGTSSPRRGARRGRRPQAGRWRRGSRRADAREQELGGAAARLDHEVARDLDQLLVPRQPARAEPVEIAAAAATDPGAVWVGPLTNAIRVRPTACRCRTASAAPLREYARTVSTGVRRRPVFRSRRRARPRGSARRRSWSRRQARSARRRSDASEVADHRQLVIRIGAGRVEQQPHARHAPPPGSTRPSPCRPGCRRRASRTRFWPVRRERSERAAAFGT